MHPIRVLFLGGGPFMPLDQPMEMLKYHYFSRYFSGDIITSTRTPKQTEIKSIGRFGYHPFVVPQHTLEKNIKYLWTYIKKARELYEKNGKYDVIIAPTPLISGITALIVGKFMGAKVIIEVNGNFESAFKYGRMGEPDATLIDSIKEAFSKVIIPLVLKKADVVKLLSDNQLEPFRLDTNKMNVRVFSSFVPVQKFIEHPRSDGKYILMIGFPWYLKGVDILIKAFNMISHDFPEYRLKVIGWCPEGRDYYEGLAEENPRVELCDPVYYHEVIPIMANSSLYVLASRTEAMGRVLVEAMACRKPIIASNVGGVYSIVSHGYNGLFFEKENVEDLADKMRFMLSHPEEAQRLADNGFQYVQEHLTEECYIMRYRDMIHDALDIEE